MLRLILQVELPSDPEETPTFTSDAMHAQFDGKNPVTDLLRPENAHDLKLAAIAAVDELLKRAGIHG